MIYRCFKSAFSTEVPKTKKVDGLTVQNASGKSMQPWEMYEETIKLDKMSFTHAFIFCEELTNTIILGLDLYSRFRIGSYWTWKGSVPCAFIKESRNWIEGTVKGDDDISPPQKEPCLILKTHVSLHLHTLSVVSVRVTDPKVVKSNQYLISDVDPNFEAQYPDVAIILLVHHTTDKTTRI